MSDTDFRSKKPWRGGDADRKLRETAKYETPEALLSAVEKYFDWAYENHLHLPTINKDGLITAVPKPRIFSVRAMCSFIGITSITYNGLKKRKDPQWLEAFARIDDAIYTDKWDNGASSIGNAGFLAKDIGLVDKSVVQFVEQPLFPDEPIPSED